MKHEEFKQARCFMFTDIRREIELANASETVEGRNALNNVGISPGGGNFMAALALLSYTEFGGKQKFNFKKGNGSDHSSKNFNEFFDGLGQEYKDFRADNNVYDIFRCGLAHEYYVKKSCIITMCVEQVTAPSIGRQSDGQYYFAVAPYCRDLERAFIDLEQDLYGESA
ncbi:MAG: hypothetical protein AB2787_13535 [Candidatus Thiodiazotropha endolucinida]